MTQEPRKRKLRIFIVSGILGACAVVAAFLLLADRDPIRQMNRGVALIEQYDYPRAYRVFHRLAEAYPGWEAARVNKGLAALNLQYLKVAEEEFGKALEVNPRSLHALVSRGVLLEHVHRIDEMLRDFQLASEMQPEDPYILSYLAFALAHKGRHEEARGLFEKVVKIQPSFATAHWQLRALYVKAGDMKKMGAALEEVKRLEAAQMGIKTRPNYGEGGKYTLAIRDSVPPGWKRDPPAWKAPESPAFGAKVKISAGPASEQRRPDGVPADPAFCLADLTGDGTLEVILCGEKGGGAGPAAAVYGRDPSGGWTLRRRIDADASAVAAGDVDGDFDQDVILAGAGWLRLFLNDGSGELTEKDLKVEAASFAGFPVRLYAPDADSDWDLDIVCLRQEAAADGRVRSRLEVINNNRDGTFRDISGESAIGPFDFPAVELVVADLDGDIDADFLILDGESGAATVLANDRAWRYHTVEPGPSAPRAPVSKERRLARRVVSSAGGDFDGDGDEDLVLFCHDALRLWRNAGGLRFEEDEAFTQRFGGMGGSTGVLADFQGALRSSLLVLDAPPGPRAIYIAAPDADDAIPLQVPGEVKTGAARSALVAVIAPDGPPELVVYDTDSGAHSFALPRSAAWLVLDLMGAKEPVPKKARSNAAGVGASVEVRAGTKSAIVRLHGGAGGAGRQPPRAHFGLAGEGSADYVRILWPDGVLQAERSLARGRLHRVKELERKENSCPILFAWTGERYEFVADFLGVGGLGYLEGRDIYSKPDPSEYVLLPELRPADGAYRLDVLEPLEECTYLDELRLTVVDHPEETTVLPLEMFAVNGPAPGFDLLAIREKVFPGRVTDDAGRDVTRELRDVDRRYANTVSLDERFPGLARSVHVLDLDFADGIAALLESGEPARRPHLFLHGYVKYGYSTSNFAAWQAREKFHAPSLRVERGGRWVALREEWGFPGGYPRYMAIDLAGLLEPGDRRLRVDTNMVIHWDQAFLAGAGSGGGIDALHLAMDRADLQFRGYPPEEAPDGALPLLYVHRDFEATAPHKTFPGDYTRYGDVRDLISAADDRFAILGPGDGLFLEVRADRLPPLGPGRRRTFLARTTGYCKDMDLYTAHPDRVEPLPFAAMSGYPQAPGESYPTTAPAEAYRREWNTRKVR